MFEIFCGLIFIMLLIVLGGLNFGSPKPPKAQKPTPSRPDDAALASAADKQRKIAAARRGRSSTVRTILSEDTSTKKTQLGA